MAVAPNASAVLFIILSIFIGSCFLSSGSKHLVVPSICPSSAITFNLVPEFNNPIERTNGLCGLVSLLTNVCKFITIAELTTTASIQFSG